MTPQKMIASILGAAAAGVVIGMLVAPEKGTDMRKTLRESSGKLMDDLSFWLGECKRYLDEMRTSAKNQVREIREAGEDIKP